VRRQHGTDNSKRCSKHGTCGCRGGSWHV
jgi:hypothetical protein